MWTSKTQDLLDEKLQALFSLQVGVIFETNGHIISSSVVISAIQGPVARS
jgi:hypothetical protein